MCEECKKLRRKISVLRRLIRVLRDWFVKRQCQLRPSGIIQIGNYFGSCGKTINTENCLESCMVEDLISKVDDILNDDKKDFVDE